MIDRWHFPGMIVSLSPTENRVQIEVEDKLNDRAFRRTFASFPTAGTVVPYWPNGNLMLNRVPMTEVESAWRSEEPAGLLSDTWKIPKGGEAEELLSPDFLYELSAATF